MSRRPRTSFAAPFILSIAAILPITAGCTKSSSGGGGHINPPDPDPDPAAYQAWNVWMDSDGSCRAESADDMECPPDASCNPPEPMPVACPEGITADAAVTLVQSAEGGDCTVDGAPNACPAWEEEEPEEDPMDEDEDEDEGY